MRGVRTHGYARDTSGLNKPIISSRNEILFCLFKTMVEQHLLFRSERYVSRLPHKLDANSIFERQTEISEFDAPMVNSRVEIAHPRPDDGEKKVPIDVCSTLTSRDCLVLRNRTRLSCLCGENKTQTFSCWGRFVATRSP